MIAPDYHPHADDLAEFLLAAFGAQAPAVLNALQVLNGNADVMRFLEAFGFVHQCIDAPDQRTENKREGMRAMVLHIHAARSLDPNTLLETFTQNGASP